MAKCDMKFLKTLIKFKCFSQKRENVHNLRVIFGNKKLKLQTPRTRGLLTKFLITKNTECLEMVYSIFWNRSILDTSKFDL